MFLGLYECLQLELPCHLQNPKQYILMLVLISWIGWYSVPIYLPTIYTHYNFIQKAVKTQFRESINFLHICLYLKISKHVSINSYIKSSQKSCFKYLFFKIVGVIHIVYNN